MALYPSDPFFLVNVVDIFFEVTRCVIVGGLLIDGLSPFNR